MKNYLIILSILFSLQAKSQIPVYHQFEDFEKSILTNTSQDTTYVINFWATWCAPCVKELPYFEAYRAQNLESPVKTVLVSMDFKNNLESRVIPFIKKRNIKSEVVLLADGKTNQWINKVDPDWSGAIPITVFIINNKRYFREKSYHSVEELTNEIHQLSKN